MKKTPPPLIFLFFCLLMSLFHFIFPNEITFFNLTPLFYLFGLISFMLAVLALIPFWRHNTTVDPRHCEHASTLITTGIYRFSRNPMYLALGVALVAWAAFLNDLLALGFVPLFFFVLSRTQIRREEAALKARFGEAFTRYCQQTRRWL